MQRVPDLQGIVRLEGAGQIDGLNGHRAGPRAAVCQGSFRPSDFSSGFGSVWAHMEGTQSRNVTANPAMVLATVIMDLPF